jgi:hypothetical protein
MVAPPAGGGLAPRTRAIFSRAVKSPASGFNVYEFDVVSEGGRK